MHEGPEPMRSLPTDTMTTAAIALAIVAACTPARPISGRALYDTHCAGCHGADGAGGGALSADLPVSAADLRRLSAANGGVFPSEAVTATIHGYRGKDTAALMPAFGPIFDGPTVDWTAPDGTVIETPEALVALTRYLETLQDE